jgi:hypothetical protein
LIAGHPKSLRGERSGYIRRSVVSLLRKGVGRTYFRPSPSYAWRSPSYALRSPLVVVAPRQRRARCTTSVSCLCRDEENVMGRSEYCLPFPVTLRRKRERRGM